MDATNAAYTSRALLPAEVELCNALELTVEEYLYFCQLTDSYTGERTKEYDLVPDIQGGPLIVPASAAAVAAGTAGTLTALGAVLVNVAIGLALSAVSYLLAPKPKGAGTPTQLKTADITGQTKFASLFGFDSLQDLAELGSVLPLVFANRDNVKNIGGIRAKAMLIWSQMLSKGSQQELKALMTLGLGVLATQPDIEGYAVGDQLLKNYSKERFSLYFRAGGGRISESADRYTSTLLPGQGFDDVFLARDELAPSKISSLFSGARTPQSQTQFGCYSPISNGSQYWISYDLVLVMNDADRVKLNKMERPYCIRQSMERLNNAAVAAGSYAIAEGNTLTFRISSALEDADAFQPHGLTDVNNAITDRHYYADDNINIGSTYIFGSAIIECTGLSTEDPWSEGTTKAFTFKCIEPGFGYFLPADHETAAVGNVPYGQHLQKISFGVVSNNRKCDQTEIGIKSVVWKRLNNFTNVNTQPDAAVIGAYAEDNTFLSLGKVNRYVNRYSFFRVEARRIGAPINEGWTDISNGQIFAVRGNSPQPQYNVLRVVHPYYEHEFRIRPIPGSTVFGAYIGNPVHLLTGTGNDIISAGSFFIAYSGQRIILTADMASNPEFIIGGRSTVGGIVNGISPTTVGEIPGTIAGAFLARAADFDVIAKTIKYGVWINQANPSLVRAYWDSIDVTDKLSSVGEYRTGPAYGIVPPVLEWRNSATEQLRLTSPAYYFEVDVSGTFIGAVWNNANVSAQTQQGNQEAPAALYRRGTQYTTAQGSTSLINDPTTPPQYDPYTANAYFGVWQVRGQPESTRRAFWNGVEVPLNVLVEVVPGQVGRYVVGTIRDYFPAINCDVFTIIRQIQTTTGSTRYFYSIQNGSYTVREPAWDTFFIDKHEFDPAKLQFAVGPADYPVTGGSGVGLVINASSFAPGQWQWLLRNGGAGYKQGEVVAVAFPDGTTVQLTLGVTDVQGAIVQAKNLNPLDAIADYWKYQEEQTSHTDGPEHEIVYVNEQVRQNTAPQYDDMALVGLRMLAGRDWTSLGQLTAYCKQGIIIERLITDAGTSTSNLRGPSNNLAEIVYNLLVDPVMGAGQKVSRTSVDRDAMQIAAKFCRANNFTWDGVVGDRVNLREWVFQQAAYCLLDFTIIGGRFALVPSVPYNPTSFLIDPSQQVPISALFTDGNIRNLSVTWLSAEERRLFKAVVSYRQEVENGFGNQKTIRVRLADGYGGSDLDIEEAFDLTYFCTNGQQAQLFAQHALLLRREIDHSISFQTTPSAAASLMPGGYIKLVSIATHTSRFYNGSIDGNGNITSTSTLLDGTYSILYWRPGDTAVKEGGMTAIDGKSADPALFNVVFTLYEETSEKRVYKIETLSITEDGFVDITGTHQPIALNGGLATIQFDPRQFLVES
jgi:hypothetical protein